MAQLPILYGTEAEIAARRQRYAGALDSLAAVARAPAAARALAAAIGTSQPFFCRIKAGRRALQAAYGGLACRVLARHETSRPAGSPPGAGEHIRLGIVSGFFCSTRCSSCSWRAG